MKNIYIAQPNYMFGNNVYLPYSAGVIAASAFSCEEIRKKYILKEFIFLREDTASVVSRLEEPFLVGFSCYLWNYEYNKKLASEIKNKFPNCIIVFGGHQIKTHSISYLENNDFIDILAYGSGEKIFKKLLIAFISDNDLSKIENISYRNGNNIVVTQKTNFELEENYISPYTTGLFDNLIKKCPQYSFHGILETNRGCPFRCDFCDWGGTVTKVIKFDIDLIMRDIAWMAENKIELIFGADANFGIMDRDENVIDLIIYAHKKFGYPKSFRTNYTKNTSDKIYRINKKLNDYSMAKGATVSFQSLNPNVLKNIGRKNINIDYFFELIKLYRTNDIPIYSELIMGLPGENYNSWCNGIEILLNNGQHTSINIYHCDLLVNAAMADDDYKKSYGIETVEIPLNHFHMIENKNDIAEYNNIIVKTNDMSKEDWVNMNMFSWIVQCMHCFGPLQMFAVYLKYDQDINYRDFYDRLLDSFEQSKNTIGNQLYIRIKNIYKGALDGGSIVFTCSDIKDFYWPTEEGTFIEIVEHLDKFYAENESFINSFGIENSIYDDLLEYQRSIIKTPNKSPFSICLQNDWHSYFNSIFTGEYRRLESRKNTLHIRTGEVYSNLHDYAINVVWYGRKGNKNIYSDIDIEYGDNL